MWLLLNFPFAEWCLCPRDGLGRVTQVPWEELSFTSFFKTKNVSVLINKGTSCSKISKFIFSGDRWIDEPSAQQRLN